MSKGSRTYPFEYTIAMINFDDNQSVRFEFEINETRAILCFGNRKELKERRLNHMVDLLCILWQLKYSVTSQTRDFNDFLKLQHTSRKQRFKYIFKL